MLLILLKEDLCNEVLFESLYVTEDDAEIQQKVGFLLGSIFENFRCLLSYEKVYLIRHTESLNMEIQST